MTMDKKPITETLELISLIACLGQTIQQARSDGKVNMMDLGSLMSLIPKVGPALDGVEKIPAELKDLDEQEQEQLLSTIARDLNLLTDDPRILEIAAASLKVAGSVLELWRAVDPNGLG